MKGAAKIVAGAIAASVGAIVLVSAPAAAQPDTRRASVVLRVDTSDLNASLNAHSVRVQQVGDSSAKNAKELEAETDKLNTVLREFIANTGFGTGATDIPKAKLTTLLVNMITKNDPSIAPDVARKTAAALGDLIDVATALDTKDIAKVAEESGPLTAAIAKAATETAAGQGPDAQTMTTLITSGGAAGTAVLSLLITGLTAYEASENLPQLTDLLDVIDPLATDGSKVFHALPKQLRTPEVEAALHIVADFGRTLASVDLIKILKLVQHFTALLPTS